jgi:hypothetical protein
VMIDNGGNGNGNGSGSSGINRFAQTAPTMIFGLLQQLQAMGLTLPEVMAQLGINQDEKLVETKEVTKQDGSPEKESVPKIGE